jgi:hypothetical protein
MYSHDDDSLIDVKLKTASHRFYKKPQKPKKSVDFLIKNQFQNLRKNQKPSGFSDLLISFQSVFYLKFKL